MDGQMNGGECITYHANEVGNNSHKTEKIKTAMSNRINNQALTETLTLDTNTYSKEYSKGQL